MEQKTVHKSKSQVILHVSSCYAQQRTLNIRYTQRYHSKELQMDHCVCYIPYFQILDISSCQVDRFYHDSFLKLPALQSLNISHNELIKIDVEVLETLVHLQRIYLKRQVRKHRIQNGILLNKWM